MCWLGTIADNTRSYGKQLFGIVATLVQEVVPEIISTRSQSSTATFRKIPLKNYADRDRFALPTVLTTGSSPANVGAETAGAVPGLTPTDFLALLERSVEVRYGTVVLSWVA